MNISERVKRFIKATNSFCIIMEDGEPAYLISSFEWAEKVFNPYDLEEVDEVNSDIIAVAEDERIEDLSSTEVR